VARPTTAWFDSSPPLTSHYAYLGNWEEREGFEGKGNRNVEPDQLRAWLKRQGHPAALIGKVLYEFDKVAGDTSKSLYDRNRAVYEMLRYGVKVRPDVGENNVTVWLVDWQHPEKNDFAIAEEVTVAAADAKAHEKRPDVVIYVNGIALGVLELKRSTVSVAEGIRQNLDNQKRFSLSGSFPPCSWSWRATTPRVSATAPSRHRKSII
jgi:type I restriction enzyme R subunit